MIYLIVVLMSLVICCYAYRFTIIWYWWRMIANYWDKQYSKAFNAIAGQYYYEQTMVDRLELTMANRDFAIEQMNKYSSFI